MKLAFIAPYKELEVMVLQISKEMNLNVDVFTGVFTSGADIAKELENKNYDILISRGATFHNISKEVKMPVINCGITSFDVLYAMYEGLKYSKKIGLIIHENIPFNHDLLSEIFGIKLTYMNSYLNYEQAKCMVDQSIEKGAEVIIGGITTVEYAEKLGVKGILLKTSEETVRQVIRNAIEVLMLSREKMIQAERLKNILEFSYEGIIVTDINGIVTYFNPAAEMIMNIKAEEIIGKKAEEFIPSTKLLETVRTGKPQLGEVQKLNHTSILTNRIPIKIKDSIYGAVATFQDITKIQDYEIKIRSELYHKGLYAKYTFDDYIGVSVQTKHMIDKSRIYAKSDSTVLISGESGTGKEILAQGIHNESLRSQYPFVVVNCSAIPEHLLESELFGYEEGAFTGAKKGGKMGVFELAHKGTIFLDEIGSMPKKLQAGLLRVLQEREVWRVGSNRVVNIDVRVIAATNNDLFDAVEKGDFRRDLYYRLNVLKVQTIPLREKKEDIEVIFKYLLNKSGKEKITDSHRLKTLMNHYHWPGNVRELENFVNRVVLLSDHIPVEEIFDEFVNEHYKESNSENKTDHNEISVKIASLKCMEDEILKKMYQEFNNNATLAAEKLNISRTTLWKKLKKNK
jgi:PAS domain S-box-containing protein